MKDSGIDWIGKIPDEWKIEKGKRIFAQRNERGNKINLELLSPTQKYGVIPQTLYEELTTYSAVKLKEGTDLSQLKTVHKGDYCISLRSFQGGFEYSKYEGVVSPAYQIFYAIKNIDECYYKYLFKDQTFIAKMNSFTMSLRDGKNIAFSDFGNTYIPLPPLSEQTKIARFLDKKCAQIDSIIEESKKSIEEYKSWKQSVIFEAVTGKNLSCKKKASGIDWIGKIPEEWIVSKAKTILHNKTVKNHPNAEVLSLYRDLGVVPKNSRDDNHNVTSEDTSSYKFVQKGELVLNKMKTWQGSLAVSNYEGIVSPAYYVCEFTNNEIDKNYIHYLLRNKMYAQEFERLSTGLRVGQWDLSIDDFLNTLIIYPPTKSEQTKIAKFLDAKCAQIDSLISEKQSLIKDLVEYKKSLIFEAVTGKRRV